MIIPNLTRSGMIITRASLSTRTVKGLPPGDFGTTATVNAPVS